MAGAKDEANGVGEGAPASGKEAVDEALSEREPTRGPDRHRLLALAIAAVVLFPALAWSGIWDPYELDAGDLARRIALRVFHAGAMDLPGAASGLPTLTDLRMGELPFTSMAVGFKLFGLHDWTGRLPLAVWGFVGAAVLYEALARLVDRRAGLYATIALVTMPLYFMQARTMLGDIVTMSALTLAFCGLLSALLDARDRWVWLAVGLIGPRRRLPVARAHRGRRGPGALGGAHLARAARRRHRGGAVGRGRHGGRPVAGDRPRGARPGPQGALRRHAGHAALALGRLPDPAPPRHRRHLRSGRPPARARALPVERFPPLRARPHAAGARRGGPGGARPRERRARGAGHRIRGGLRRLRPPRAAIGPAPLHRAGAPGRGGGARHPRLRAGRALLARGHLGGHGRARRRPLRRHLPRARAGAGRVRGRQAPVPQDLRGHRPDADADRADRVRRAHRAGLVRAAAVGMGRRLPAARPPAGHRGGAGGHAEPRGLGAGHGADLPRRDDGARPHLERQPRLRDRGDRGRAGRAGGDDLHRPAGLLGARRQAPQELRRRVRERVVDPAAGAGGSAGPRARRPRRLPRAGVGHAPPARQLHAGRGPPRRRDAQLRLLPGAGRAALPQGGLRVLRPAGAPRRAAGAPRRARPRGRLLRRRRGPFVHRRRAGLSLAHRSAAGAAGEPAAPRRRGPTASAAGSSSRPTTCPG